MTIMMMIMLLLLLLLLLIMINDKSCNSSVSGLPVTMEIAEIVPG